MSTGHGKRQAGGCRARRAPKSARAAEKRSAQAARESSRAQARPAAGEATAASAPGAIAKRCASFELQPRLPSERGEVQPPLVQPRQGTRGSRRRGRVQVLLEALAEKLNKKTSNIRPIFRSFDENKDGTVSYAEIRHGFNSI